jgi:predicted alpha/beta superfamily hydrolase
MSKIFFRNTNNWNNVYAIIGNKKILLTNVDSMGNFIVEFDNSVYNSIRFENEIGEKTGTVYPGLLDIGVEDKVNENMGKSLTYLFSKEDETTGRVDNFVLTDEENLTHREDMSKKISVFVPKSYDGVTPHNILYFFDAQNLFGEAGKYTENGDPYGSWQLDVVLTEIHRQFGKKIIVVGIDNADKYRDQELFMDPAKFGILAPLASALPDEDYSKGYLDDLDDFIKQTLHPFIKQKYSVLDENIGIGGASMGGIAAFYCGLREIGFYKYVLSYSPAYGLYEMSAFENWFATKNFSDNKDILPKIHIYCGEGDPLERLLIGSSKEMKGILVRYGYPDEKVFETYDEEKPHNEESWRLILPQSFEKLL